MIAPIGSSPLIEVILVTKSGGRERDCERTPLPFTATC